MSLTGLVLGFLAGFVLLVVLLHLQRAGNGRRGADRPGKVAPAAPPYDWAQEPDL